MTLPAFITHRWLHVQSGHLFRLINSLPPPARRAWLKTIMRRCQDEMERS